MRSMTGCGKGQAEIDHWLVTVEIKTVNHRFLDTALRLPRNLMFLEDPLRRCIASQVHRGHADVFVSVRNSGMSTQSAAVDQALAAAYLSAAEELKTLGGFSEGLRIADLMQLPGVVTLSEAELAQEPVQLAAMSAAEQALDSLVRMRIIEGKALCGDLQLHLNEVIACRQEILTRAPQVPAEFRQKLEARLSALNIGQVDETRLAQEVALLADRCAIDEELSRLESHILQFQSWLQDEEQSEEEGVTGEIGKKMDFLIQEMNREANTIGSKANDAAIASCVVRLKAEIEKLREQVQNVE